MMALKDLCGSVTSHLADSPLLRTETGEIHNNFFRGILTGKPGESETQNFQGHGRYKVTVSERCSAAGSLRFEHEIQSDKHMNDK